jgi:hypothetical protein
MDKQQRALEAKELLDNEPLQRLFAEIREDAQTAFLKSGGNPDQMTAAFQKVRAVETILAELNNRVNGFAYEEKRKEQQRERHA